VLTRHKLDAGPGDANLAVRLAGLAKDQDSRVLLEIVIALGRLRWADAPDWLRQNLKKPDAALAHAAMQTLRRSGNWPAVLKLLDEPDTVPMRAIALRAVAEQYEPKVVDGLIERLAVEKDAARRRAYADALTRVYKKPGPWVYWGYRPPPRPANTVAWERSEAIALALDTVLADTNRDVRLAVLLRMQREKVPCQLATLGQWLQDEHQSQRVAALLVSLRDQPPAEARKYLEAAVIDKQHTSANRLAALALFVRGLDEATADRLLALAQSLEDGPVLADVLQRISKYPKLPAAAALAGRLKSPDAQVRAAAIEALGEWRAPEGREPVLWLLQDKDARVRSAAAGAAGKLGVKQAADQLVKLVADADPAVRRASLDALRVLGEPRVVALALAALGDRHLELTALACLGELGGPDQAGAVAEFARSNPSAEVSAGAVRVLTAWRDRKGTSAAQKQVLDRAVAEIHGAHGILVRWQGIGPVPAKSAPQVIEQFAAPGSAADPAGWRTLFAGGLEARVGLAPKDAAKDGSWFAYTDLAVQGAAAVEFLASSSGSLRVWLNGKELYRRDQARSFQVDSDRFAGTLSKGVNRLLVQVGPGKEGVAFHLRFRHKSSKAEYERLTLAALGRAGNPEKGRKLFFDVEKSLCLKCHRLGDQGERIGPELTGVGGRFSRIYLVESILEPSRTIAPSFGTLVVTLKDGKVLTGVKVAETETTLTLGDSQGQKHAIQKSAVDEQRSSPGSTMPEGLEQRFTEDEFVDLIAFLASQKEGRLP
jgi:putative heme-binding domain-containing protein